MQGVQGKIIVITGASAGIGATTAKQAGAAGAKLILAARRKKELDEVAAESGSGHLVVPTDVTVRAQVEALAKAALDTHGRVDVWINNAGRGISKPTSQLDDDDLDTMFRDNVKSALYGMQAILPHFKERNDGQIINLSSLLGRIPYVPVRSAYAAAKHALNALTATLRLELRGSYPGIRLTTISPGPVATDFGTTALHGGADSKTFPGAQSADEVAEHILRAIVERPIDVYTRAVYADQVRTYYNDIDAVERASPFAQPKP